ncbi:MAG: family 16 glycosylhydrolase [Candidatus Levybacteria bacterium]|nr:family 16 glycosylhydrolase [Candidatus Levybacteria bacterium]
MKNNKRLPVYLLVLALVIAIPFTILAGVTQRQDNRSNAQSARGGIAPTSVVPTFGCVSNEPCATPAPTQTTTTHPVGGTNQGNSPVGGTNPNPVPANPVLENQPCTANGTAGVFTENKHKEKNGGGFIERFIKWILKFIELFFKLLGISIPNPGQIPQPNPDLSREPAPCPEPTVPVEPTMSSAEPTNASEPTQAEPTNTQTVEPTLNPGNGSPTATTCAGNGTGGSLNYTGWALVGCDDFNGTAVDTSKWGMYDGPGHAGQGRRSPGQATVKNGILTITGLPNGTTEGMAWKGGQKYGRWEGRVKAPVSDPSYNALLLLWPDAEDFPVGGEVDFMEMLDNTRQKTNFFLHYGANNDQISGEVKIDGTQWHNWAVEWTPTQMVAYVDGREWYKTTDTSKFPPRAMHVTIQLDWFPKGGAVKQSEMQVDWIHIYKKN